MDIGVYDRADAVPSFLPCVEEWIMLCKLTEGCEYEMVSPKSRDRFPLKVRLPPLFGGGGLRFTLTIDCFAQLCSRLLILC